MAFDRVMWLCGALFFLFGLPLVFFDLSGWRNLLLGLCALSLGGFALAMAGDGMVQGEIRLQFSRIRRSARPRLFWAAIALVSAAGAAVSATAFWALLF